MTTNKKISPIKFCYNKSFTLPEQSKRSTGCLKKTWTFFEIGIIPLFIFYFILLVNDCIHVIHRGPQGRLDVNPTGLPL